MTDKTPQVQSFGKRLWNAAFGRSPAPGSGADYSTQGQPPIRVSFNLVQKNRRIGNDNFRLPGPHRPSIPYSRALIIRAGKLDKYFATGRIWFAEELNREPGIFVKEEGGYRLVDYDDQGKEIASQDVPTALLGNPQEDKDQGPRTLENLRLFSIKGDQLPKYHFWKRDDEVEPVGRIFEQPQASMEPPRKRDDRPQWKITADAVDHAFAMDRCRTYRPPEFRECGEKIPNFNIATNQEHRTKFQVKRQQILQLFTVQKMELFDIVNDTFDPVQKQLLLPALYVNAVHERQEQDKVKYAEAMGENGAYHTYPDNAITKMTMLWFGQPIAPLRYMEVTRDYTKHPDGIPKPEPDLPRFERVTNVEAPLEFLDMFDERSYGYPMLRTKRLAPKELERRAQLFKEQNTTSFTGPDETIEKNTEESLIHLAGNAKRTLANPDNGGGGLQSVQGGSRDRGARRGQISLGGTPTVTGTSISTISAGHDPKTPIVIKPAPAVSQPAPVKLGASFQQLSGGYVPRLRGGQLDNEISNVLAHYGVSQGQSGHSRSRPTSRLQAKHQAESMEPSSSQATDSNCRSTQAHSTKYQTTQTQTTARKQRNTKDTSTRSSQNQDQGKKKDRKQSSTKAVETPIGQDAQSQKHQRTAVQIWGPKMELLFRMTWPEIRQKENFLQMVIKNTSQRLRSIDGVRFAMDTKYPKPSRVFTAKDVLTDADVPDITKRPKVLWVIPYWNTIEISDVTPSQDIADPDQSTRPGVTIEWSQDKNMTSLRECLKKLYDEDWDDQEEVIINYLNQDNVPRQLMLTAFTHESEFWLMMNDLANPELYIKRPGSLDPEYRPSNPTPMEGLVPTGIDSTAILESRDTVMKANMTTATINNEQRSGTDSTAIPETRDTVMKANTTTATTNDEQGSGNDSTAILESRDTFSKANMATATTNDEPGSRITLPFQETILRHPLGLKEREKAVHPNLVKYVEPRSKKRSRSEWEDWLLDQEKKDRKKHDEYTMERSIYSYDDPPLIPSSGRPLQKGITGGSSVATVYVRNVTATDQARLQRQRRKLENIHLDRVKACPVCPEQFPPGPQHTHEVEAHWQWHRDRLMEDKSCPLCGDTEWVSFDLDLKRQHLRNHTRNDLETCPSINCNVNLRDPDLFPTVVEAAQHILGHEAPPLTETFNRLRKQQGVLRHAINMVGVPTLRNAICKWVMPNGAWCGEDLNDMTKYGNWQNVCDHLLSHYTPRTQNTQSGNGHQVIKSKAASLPDRYVCRMIVDGKQCTYVTHTFGSFYQHLNVTHRPPLSCPMCQAKVTGELNLMSHIDSAHPPQMTDHPCPAGSGNANPCGRKFSSNQLLFEHIVAEHSTERPPVIKCQRGNGCVFETQDSVAFDEHLRAHEGRALRCGECNYVSYGENLDALREHLVGHAMAKVSARTNKIYNPRREPPEDLPPRYPPSRRRDPVQKSSDNLGPGNPSSTLPVPMQESSDSEPEDPSSTIEPNNSPETPKHTKHIEFDDEMIPVDLNEDGTKYQPKEPLYLWCNHCWMKASSGSHVKRHQRTCGLDPEERESKTTYFAALLRTEVDKNFTPPRRPKDFFVPEVTPSVSTTESDDDMPDYGDDDE